MVQYIRRPTTFEAFEITDATSATDFQELYTTAKPAATGTVDAVNISGQWYVTTSDAPDWTGRFAIGDLVTYTEPIFQKLEPAAEYAPYDQVYVTTP